MKQEIFYVYKDTKILVKPKLDKTIYKFKLNERELFQLEIPLSDSYVAREVVNKYIEKLRMH